MKKSFKEALAALLFFTLTLTACSKSATDTDQDTLPPSETESATKKENELPNLSEAINPKETRESTSAENEETTSESALKPDFSSAFPEGLVLLGTDGQPISLENDVNDVITDENGHWMLATCDGFTYIAEPTGISFNSIENADIFDPEADTFDGVLERSQAEYRRCYVGDTICGFTVKSASALFVNNYADFTAHNDDPDGYIGSCFAELEGTVTLTGFAAVLSSSQSETMDRNKGDLLFYPDNESQILPFIGSVRGGVFRDFYTKGIWDYRYVSEYDTIKCGNVYMKNFKIELSDEEIKMLEEDLVKVKITVSAVSLSSTPPYGWQADCVLESLEFV